MEDKLLFSENICTKYPDKPALIGDGFSYTYAEFLHAIAAYSKVLADKGVKKGSRVALWGYNSANWLVAFFAIVRAGGTAVLINYSSDIEPAADLLKMSETKFLICGDNKQTAEDSDAMKKMAKAAEIDDKSCFDIRKKSTDLCKDLEKLPEAKDVLSSADADQTSVIIFTSGTTSLPKAVQNSQRAISTNAKSYLEGVEGYQGTGICISVPLFHILGLLMSYCYLCTGASVCLPEVYDSETLAKLIDKYKVSDMAAVGAIYLKMVESPEFQEKVVPHIHLCMIAGGMSTPVQMMRLELEFENAIFINMYGQSEVAPISMVKPKDDVEKRAQTVGQPVEELEVKIIDEKKQFVSGGSIGEIVARGSGLMNGYFNLPDEKQPIDSQGWIHTGDLGYFDKEGYLCLAGRIKDLIIKGGENISPSEIEEALSQIPGIREAKAMGAPHPIYGESVEACVTLQDGTKPLTEEAIKKALKSKLAKNKIPSHVFIYENFPLNENGKIDQRGLHADMIRRLATVLIDEELSGGIVVYDIVVKNSSYAIVPVASLIQELAVSLGFNEKKTTAMRYAVEEMLTDRIQDAYSAVGNINVRVTLMPEWLRVSFSDEGAEYFIDKRASTSISAKIILSAVDNFYTDRSSGKPVYCMDFLYETDVEIKEFLLRDNSEPNTTETKNN